MPLRGKYALPGKSNPDVSASISHRGVSRLRYGNPEIACFMILVSYMKYFRKGNRDHGLGGRRLLSAV